jgi:hypothetical protein
MMNFKSYDWIWSEHGGKRILSIIFRSASRVEYWQEIYYDALADFEPDNLMIMVDIRVGGSAIGRDGFIDLLALAHSLGALAIAVAMVIDDRAYRLKKEMLEETAVRMGEKFSIESFNNTEDAEKWLLAIEFMATSKE